MVESKEPYDRLYLYRDGKQDIFVDLFQKLPQHQLDGIRFLYRQFYKKKLGVILNDPSGYGKCLQVVLFLNAVKVLLSKGALIICQDNEIENWKKHFREWTNSYEELSIESTNPYSNRAPIFINSVKDALTLCRRDWSVVVIHDHPVSRDTLRTVFKADYKVWITSVDMKENLVAFAAIYEWIHPNNRFKIEEFATLSRSNPVEVLHRAIMLDAYLEDIVLRRNDFKTPFKKAVDVHPSSILESLLKPSRKNKDPTGTKVKRSKKKKIDDPAPEIPPNTEEIVDKATTSNVFDNGGNTADLFNFEAKKDSLNDRDVETFIRYREPVNSDGYRDFIESNENRSEDISENIRDTNNISFETAVNNVARDENGVNEKTMREIEPNDSIKENVAVSAVSLGFNSVANDMVANVYNDTNGTLVNYTSELNKGDTTENSEESSNLDFQSAIDDIVSFENTVHVNDAESEIEEKSEVVARDTIGSVVTSQHSNNDIEEFSVINKVLNESDVPTKHNEILVVTNDFSIKNNDVIRDEVKDSVKEKAKNKGHLDIDDELSELEERMMKKFKGSLLDRLF